MPEIAEERQIVDASFSSNSGKKAHSDCGNLQGPFIVSVERFLPFLFNDKIPCYPATGPAGIIKREGHAGR